MAGVSRVASIEFEFKFTVEDRSCEPCFEYSIVELLLASITGDMDFASSTAVEAAVSGAVATAGIAGEGNGEKSR